MSTTTTEREPAYRVRRNAEGLTEREQQVRDLLAQGIPQVEIAARVGVNKQRVTEIKKKLAEKGKLEAPKPLEPLTKSEWRATSAALRDYAAKHSGESVGSAASRAIEKARQLVPDGVTW